MLEALEYYQSLAQRFHSQLLCGPGIAVVLMGLSVWLAGLRWRKILGVLAATAIAVTGVFAVGCGGLYTATIAAGAGVLAGILFDKAVLGIFGALLAAGIVLMFFACNKVVNHPASKVEFYQDSSHHNPRDINAEDFVTRHSYPVWPEYEANAEPIPSRQAVEITVKMAGYFADNAKKGLSLCGTAGYAAAGFAAITTTVIAMAAVRLFISLMSAAMGTVIIFTGMIMLLFYKGSEPVTLISQRPWFYLIVFAAMIIFGSAVQLVLSPQSHKTITPVAKVKGEEK